MIKQEMVFDQAMQPGLSYRIPALHAAPDGTLYAFCEARTGSGGDWEPAQLYMRRMRPGGMWEAPRAVASNGHGPVHNPAPFQAGGELHLLYGMDYKRFYHVYSRDGGDTFSAPEDITYVFESFRGRDVPGGTDWHCIAVGPGGIARLESGRIVVPVWLGGLVDPHSHAPCQTGSIYSDDDGASWHAGDIVDIFALKPSEAQIAALPEGAPGRAIISLRNNSAGMLRGFAYSPDGAHWCAPVLAENVAEIDCEGSLLRAGDMLVITGPEPEGEHRRQRRRERLTLHVSRDWGRTWSAGRVIVPGTAGYSALAVSAAGELLCLYETWEDSHVMRQAMLTITPDELDKMC